MARTRHIKTDRQVQVGHTDEWVVVGLNWRLIGKLAVIALGLILLSMGGYRV